MCVCQRKKSNTLKMAPISVYATYCAHFVFPSFLHYNGMHIQLSKIHVLPRFQNKMPQDRILEKNLILRLAYFGKRGYNIQTFQN